MISGKRFIATGKPGHGSAGHAEQIHQPIDSLHAADIASLHEPEGLSLIIKKPRCSTSNPTRPVADKNRFSAQQE